MLAGSSTLTGAEVNPNFHCYLLFGQSNMAGGGATSDNKTLDCDTSARIKVLAFSDCSGSGSNCTLPLQRTHDKWYTSFPPLHSCSEGISPGDNFARTMLDSVSSDISIGLIPCALSGQSIDVFKKGGSGYNIPTWAQPAIGNGSPYSWMLERCRLAQQTGVIKGILFHQGESDNGSPTWIPRLTAILDNLKKDLDLDSRTPVIVGELRQDNVSPLPCCSGHNKLVDSLAKIYPNCAVASSKDLAGNGKDQWHFTAAGMRELGKRYARALLSIADSDFIPRKGSTAVTRSATALSPKVGSSWPEGTAIYSLDGKLLTKLTSSDNAATWHAVNPGAVYLVTTKKSGNSARLMVIP